MTTKTKQVELEKTVQNRARMEEAIRHYVRYHLKPGDLDKVPALRKYMDN